MATKIVVNQGYIDMIEWQLQSLLLYNEVKTSSIHKTFLSDQEDILKKTKNVGYKSFDIQVMYMLIRNLGSKNQRLRKGRWDGNSMPSPGEIRVGDDLERIRMIRNSLAVHVSSASNPQTELDETWLILSDICRKLKTFTIKMYMDDLEKLTSKEKEDAIMKINKTKKPHKMMKEAMSSVQEFIMKMLKPETKYDSDLNFQTQSETV
ncbi:uncharacterized protein LOC134272203 [Saccostrea cucullata]|uniref:uncharacterized protein LOC134272203 n=1 Tax=Saccostrea cuccullata TaxID=36930 RepID=UPI002ED11A03